MSKPHIASVPDLIEHFNGVTATGRVFGVSAQVVVRWRTRGKLPARSYFPHLKVLQQHGVAAAPALWGMAEAAE